ncbi:hypothetical protein ABG79_00253 [Caloramator mitchellensis]|uniref:Type 4 fimbrial biogenesis protein PilX N-terminal domain-containing protein n=1 Tax=Caloramator mitchellensis TaxID=908809 RepID=A0A0R3JWZ9_CALMK|nr:pilus assembly PilX N-terminal domain-containing protein [Caloramator mitchellensis]KRQ88086.1 hypothetical protein ABG79_00253 [Caloramator mitchellensis]
MKRKGSAIIFVVLILSVLFTLSVGIMEISLASLRQSSNYYSRNLAFYYSDVGMEKVLFYIDKIADEARKQANDVCFDSSGGPNLNDIEINSKYTSYMKGELSKEDYEAYMRERFIKEFNTRIVDFFDNRLEISSTIIKNENGNINDVQISNKRWNDWYNFIINELNDPDVSQKVTLSFYILNDILKLNNIDEDFKKLIPMNFDKSQFEDLNKDKKGYLKETIFLKVQLKDNNIKRFLLTTIELNPFGVDYNSINLSNKKIKKGYNGVLDYALIAGKNLFVVNGNNDFIVNGDIYARGTGNKLSELKSFENYGGILIGTDNDTKQNLTSSKASVNTLLGTENINTARGKMILNGNAYLGDLSIVDGATEVNDKYVLNSGFIRVINQDSQLNINGDIYCHSIVTDDTAEGASINITGNAYIADNVSIYGTDSKIKIDKDLIAFETADGNAYLETNENNTYTSDTNNSNYTGSSSIVINDDTGSIEIGKNIVLFGTAYVADFKKKDDQNKSYRTLETAAINPNFIAYNYLIDEIQIGNNILKWKTDGTSDYDTYILQNEESTEVSMFNTDKSANGLSFFDRTLGFILHYLVGQKIYPEIYDYQYNLATNENGGSIIKMNNIKVSNSGETSYFPFLLSADGKLYSMENIYNKYSSIDSNAPEEQKNYAEDLQIIKNELNNTFKVFGTEGDIPNPANIKANLIRDIVIPTKKQVVNKLLFKDKGLDSTKFEDYLDFENTPNIEIVDKNNKIFIKVTSDDIEIDLAKYKYNADNLDLDQYQVLIVSKKNITIKNSSTDSKTIKGNIIAGENVIVEGGNIDLSADIGTSLKLMNYFNAGENYDDCLKLYRFFAKGTLPTKIYEKDIYTGFKETVKSNIKVLKKRQILIK